MCLTRVWHALQELVGRGGMKRSIEYRLRGVHVVLCPEMRNSILGVAWPCGCQQVFVNGVHIQYAIPLGWLAWRRYRLDLAEIGNVRISHAARIGVLAA